MLCRLVVNYDEMVTKEHALLNRIQVTIHWRTIIQNFSQKIQAVTGEEERVVLAEKSRKQKYTATLLPIRTVGVQVSCRTGFFTEYKSVY